MGTAQRRMLEFLFAAIIALSAAALLTGCPAEQDEEKSGSIDRATKKVADAAVDYIQTPKEKAEAVKEIEEARHKTFEEQPR